MASTRRPANQPSADGTYTHADRFHTGPGTLGGRFLRRFWHPVYMSQDLPSGQARPIRIMSEDFTLYRGQGGTPHVVAYRCAHRRTQLSVGWVEGDCIRCMYHGWKYDETGQCIEQPAEPNPWAEKVRIRSYPTQEYLGFIFAYLGEGEPPPFPRYPEFESFQGILNWNLVTRKCNVWNNLENSLDHTHNGFVHRNNQGAWDGVAVSPAISAEESIWGITTTASWPNGHQDITQWGMPNVLHVIAASTQPDIADYNEVILIKVPIDDESHLQFVLLASPVKPGKEGQVPEKQARRHSFSPELADAVRRGEVRLEDLDLSLIDLVNLQDDLVQVGQGVIADDDEEEMLGQSDTALILVRKLWHREMQALAEGRPLKQWTYDRELLPVQDWRISLPGLNVSASR